MTEVSVRQKVWGSGEVPKEDEMRGEVGYVGVKRAREEAGVCTNARATRALVLGITNREWEPADEANIENKVINRGLCPGHDIWLYP